MPRRVAVVPGDGIGPEVVGESVSVLRTLNRIFSLDMEFVDFPWGAEHYLEFGETLPEDAVEMLNREFGAIFMGAMGDPRVPDMVHARDIVLGLRRKLDLYVNQRPIKLLDQRLTPLKDKGKDDIDFVILRENTEGSYVGCGGWFKKGSADEIAIEESINTRKGVERIIRYAFSMARQYGYEKVTMADKSNAIRFGHDLWYRVFQEIGEEYPDIEMQHLYIDVLTAELIRAPEQFQIIVTCNLFGDILADLSAQLMGGLGLAASANLNPGKVSLFEPVHGSAPKLAGRGLADPVAAILSGQLLLGHFGLAEYGAIIEEAVRDSLQQGITTPDLGGHSTTQDVGAFIRKRIEELADEK
ncbi:MAG: isocitrate/isopropylmalate dehydrogenase family protein [Deltaproteobacteria bacterium]|nr:isocitrate/isopropylmalate dehydrogenase family protein [Deltaproteobacteria bacterium]